MELWSPAHIRSLLPSIGVMLILCALLRLWLGKKPLRIRMIPVQVIAVLLILLEIGKQTVSFSKGYNLYHIPLHFCSLFLFSIPLMAFYRGRYEAVVRTVTPVLSGSAMLLMTSYPALIYPAWDVENYFSGYFSFHTVTFHGLVYFAYLLILTLQLYGDFGEGVGGFCRECADAQHAHAHDQRQNSGQNTFKSFCHVFNLLSKL